MRIARLLCAGVVAAATLTVAPASAEPPLPHAWVSVSGTTVTVWPAQPADHTLFVVEHPEGVRIGGGFLTVRTHPSSQPGCTDEVATVVCRGVTTEVVVKGGSGNDWLVVSAPVRAVLKGGKGDDHLVGGPFGDRLFGQAGNDRLRGGGEADVLKGQGGDDRLDGGPGADAIIGNGGTDTVVYHERPKRPVVTFDNVANDGEPGEHDNVRAVEHVHDLHNFVADRDAVPRSGEITVDDSVWSGTWAGLDLVTRADLGLQAVAYYDNDNGLMTVAIRRLGETTWHKYPLATQWPYVLDFHNYVTLAFDPEGRLHVAGNMHVSPLQYFRTRRPVTDPAQLVFDGPLAMVGSNESIVTYPGFWTNSDGRFMFRYRGAGGTRGANLYVRAWDPIRERWDALTQQPYFSGLAGVAPDDTAGIYSFVFEHAGEYHIVAKINFEQKHHCGDANARDLCQLTYFKTRDWVNFYDVSNRKLRLPITPHNAPRTLVDPARYGGLFWTGAGVGPDGRIVIVYETFDALRSANGVEGRTQAYAAWWDGKEWRRVKLSDWDQWHPGHGSYTGFNNVVPPASGTVWHVSAGIVPRTGAPSSSTGWLALDVASGTVSSAPSFAPPGAPCNNVVVRGPVSQPWTDPVNGATMVADVQRSRPDLDIHLDGTDDESGDYYYLRWEHLSPDADRASPRPPPTSLTLRRTNCERQW